MGSAEAETGIFRVGFLDLTDKTGTAPAVAGRLFASGAALIYDTGTETKVVTLT